MNLGIRGQSNNKTAERQTPGEESQKFHNIFTKNYNAQQQGIPQLYVVILE